MFTALLASWSSAYLSEKYVPNKWVMLLVAVVLAVLISITLSFFWNIISEQTGKESLQMAIVSSTVSIFAAPIWSFFKRYKTLK